MDPFTLGVAAVGTAIIGALTGAGAVAAPLAAAAAAAGPVVTAATAVGAPAAAAAVAGSAAPAALIASDPHAAQGAQNGIAVAVNQAQNDFAHMVNGLGLPGVQIHVN